MRTDILTRRANAMGDRAVAQQCDALTATNPPAGATIERIDGGICLSGKRLRLRMLTDPFLRNFGHE